MATAIKFDAQISAWVAKLKQRQEAVFRESVQRLVEQMQLPVGSGGNMPVDTGFLRSSLRLSIGVMSAPTIANVNKVSVSYDGGAAYAVTINKAKIGDIISARYLAVYARRVEMGFVGKDSAGRDFHQKGHGFVRLAAQRWNTIVRQVSAELKSRAA